MVWGASGKVKDSELICHYWSLDGIELTTNAVNGTSNTSRGTASLSSSAVATTSAAPGHQQSSSSSPIDRLTCHLCNRTLSRRDKLKRHIVRCCETHKRDVEIALLVAGFTAKDVEVTLEFVWIHNCEFFMLPLRLSALSRAL